ncbi:MAG: alanine racemase [Acidobacteriota bacterium]|nr:alanine racemase [Acidobacteriota bacterium]
MRIEELETPAIVVDLDLVEKNINSLSQYARQHRLQLRPHTKTHKIPEIAKMQIALGGTGITVAKVGEAEVMAKAGLDDILIHYPVFGDTKVKRLADLARSCKITVAVDSIVTATAISRAAKAAGAIVHLLVEVDVGMHRCGLKTPAEVEDLARAIQDLHNVSFAGITMYPGHIWLPPEQQATELKTVAEAIEQILDSLNRAGIQCETVSGGSTPTAYNSHLFEHLTEIRPGTYVFNDRNTVGVGACSVSQCALRVIVTVVSTAVPGRTIIDGGSKTFSGDRWLSGEKSGFGYVMEAPDLRFEAMSEEHGHLNSSASSHQPEIGEKLSIIPNHVCACVNMHEEIYYHRNGIVEGCWHVAGRGRVR